MIDICSVHKSYGGLEVLRGINLRVAEGEIVALVGRSGGGKSTLLRCINHLEKIDSGQIFVDGELVGYRRSGNALYELSPKKLAAQRSRIGMVFQGFNLFSHRTVLENVMSGPIVTQGRSRGSVKDEALGLLARVGLEDKTDVYPRQLSGGQQQRVAIARALAMRPKVMLFDEPTSALDPQLVGEVLNVIRQLAEDGMTMVIVTHEIRFAHDISDTVAFIDAGRIIEMGPPSQVLDRPREAATLAYLGGAGVERIKRTF